MGDTGFEDFLSTAHVYSMLRILRVNGETKQDDIDRQTCRNHKRTPAKLRMMEENGLVTHRIGTSGSTDHKACLWDLTPKGRALAECLENGRRIFEGELRIEDQ